MYTIFIDHKDTIYIKHMQLFYDLAKLSKKLSLKYLKTGGYPGIC